MARRLVRAGFWFDDPTLPLLTVRASLSAQDWGKTGVEERGGDIRSGRSCVSIVGWKNKHAKEEALSFACEPAALRLVIGQDGMLRVAKKTRRQ